MTAGTWGFLALVRECYPGKLVKIDLQPLLPSPPQTTETAFLESSWRICILRNFPSDSDHILLQTQVWSALQNYISAIALGVCVTLDRWPNCSKSISIGEVANLCKTHPENLSGLTWYRFIFHSCHCPVLVGRGFHLLPSGSTVPSEFSAGSSKPSL